MTAKTAVPKALDEMKKEEFDAIMAESLEQSKNGKTLSIDESCDAIIIEIENGTI
ncbi:MAG: hypothetical protein ILP22_01165 [Oscillospiraceae bacterium]|nr:hypothetical protein [Oscillospiraceae bacterium]